MNRLASAIAGGVAGTSVLSLLMLLLDVQTRSALGIFAAIARFVRLPGQLALGFLLFVLVGVVAWPLVFIAVVERIPTEDPAAAGVLFAVPLWAAFVLIGRGTLVGGALFVYAGFSLLAHLAYGYVLGAVFEHFAGTVPAADRRAPGGVR